MPLLISGRRRSRVTISVLNLIVFLLLVHRPASAEGTFRKVVLENRCEDPMELVVAPDGRVLFVERGGNLRIWMPQTKTTAQAAHFDVFRNFNGTKNTSWEDGLVGDNTNPFESDGYDPIDYRPGRAGWDAARSAGNTSDLRGKILRIHPEPDGHYSIPPGNLFPPGTPKTRPEIFVMGCRNPFRMSVDLPTGTLFWGDVGPDAHVPKPERGPSGFDEFNRARQAGNFGWPFLIGDNKPYRAYDFGGKTSGPPFSAANPRNLSANNTGLTELPPAQPAWICYPYSPSARFPQLGSGGRTACAGPVYHYDPALNSPGKLPREFDQTIFLYDWARHWIMNVSFDVNGHIQTIRRFAPELTFKRTIDLELGPDGCLYLIEFGTNWERNTDSQVVRLEFSSR